MNVNLHDDLMIPLSSVILYNNVKYMLLRVDYILKGLNCYTSHKSMTNKLLSIQYIKPL